MAMTLHDAIIEAGRCDLLLDDGATTWDADNLIDAYLESDDGRAELMNTEVNMVVSDDETSGTIQRIGPDGYIRSGEAMYSLSKTSN